MRFWVLLIVLVGFLGCKGKSSEPKPEEPIGKNPKVPAALVPDFAPLADPTKTEIAEGWLQLFDGETLFGWEPNDKGKENAVNWRVEQGVITADEGEPGLLLTYVPFADFEFRCEYRLAKNGNSGVFLRTNGNQPDITKDCYELNFCENHDSFPTGSLVERRKVDKPLVNDNQWIPVHVTCRGKTIKARFGDQNVLDFTDDSENAPLSGRIGLQKNAEKIEFRHLAIKPLGTKPIFNGKDLTGWRGVAGSKSQFEVNEGTIQVTGGKGFLETENTWANFVLETQAITNGDGVNSGIFFRGLPGEEAKDINGYEVQIQHKPSPSESAKKYIGDRTGGIFRQIAPRKVVTKDREWFSMTLIASGPRFATWVEGVPMVTWEDERTPDENPRKGLRLKAGHLSLQGHDETTDLQFRGLKISRFLNHPIPKPTTCRWLFSSRRLLCFVSLSYWLLGCCRSWNRPRFMRRNRISSTFYWMMRGTGIFLVPANRSFKHPTLTASPKRACSSRTTIPAARFALLRGAC